MIVIIDLIKLLPYILVGYCGNIIMLGNATLQSRNTSILLPVEYSSQPSIYKKKTNQHYQTIVLPGIKHPHPYSSAPLQHQLNTKITPFFHTISPFLQPAYSPNNHHRYQYANSNSTNRERGDIQGNHDGKKRKKNLNARESKTTN
ncbi:hypothetical protein EX30DRAFT_14246 [Ascodesmis nigricans]|uniref:Uncharacterized protein n=1 Tax=Ascodesmis nigricans TaxID=341454 RepID=A0A4S2N6T4_9PEZI|nr:hypothetical protein EX30DRAFT_14246 [Ascodesmis nigricans]